MGGANAEVIKNHAAFIWSVADLLRGDYKQSEYGRVILPLTVLRRLDCVLAPTEQGVLERAARYKRVDNIEPILCRDQGAGCRGAREVHRPAVAVGILRRACSRFTLHRILGR